MSEHKEFCRDLFKNAFERFKKSLKSNNKAQELIKDSYIHQKITINFRTLSEMIKFCVLSNEEYYYHLKPNISHSINIPKTEDDIINLYKCFPKTIDLIKDDLYSIVSMDNYEGLLLVNNINTLFFSSVVDSEVSEKIELLEIDNIHLEIFIKNIIRKLMPIYLEFYKALELNPRLDSSI